MIYKNEIWKDVPGFEGFYQISNYGRIKSLSRSKRFKEKIRVLRKHKNGYLYTVLSAKNKRQTVRPHRLVALCFLPNETLKNTVNHKDFDRINNYVDNLEWNTIQENIIHSCINGRHYKKPILQLSLNGDLVKEWESAWSVQVELGYFSTNISRCCLGKKKTYKKHKWRFKYE